MLAGPDQGPPRPCRNARTIVTGDISTGFECLQHEVGEGINFNSACQYKQQVYIGSENGGLYVYSLETGVVEPLLEGIPKN